MFHSIEKIQEQQSYKIAQSGVKLIETLIKLYNGIILGRHASTFVRFVHAVCRHQSMVISIFTPSSVPSLLVSRFTHFR